MNANATSTAADGNTWQPLSRPQHRRHVGHEHDDESGHRRHDEHAEGDSGTRLFLDLKLKVAATLTDSAGATGPEPTQALEDFTQTLFSALGNLFTGSGQAGDAAAAGTATVALDMRVRLRYTSLDAQAGELTRRLARPEGQAALPATLRTDLSLRFDAMLQTRGGGGTNTLPDFLQALAARFNSTPPAAAPSVPPEPDATSTAPAANVATLFAWRLSLSYREVSSAPATLALAA